jgi:hypothetical protein
MRILIINISDDHVLGDKCHVALKKKYPEATILQRNLMSAALGWLQGRRQESDGNRESVVDNDRDKERFQWNRHMSRIAESTSVKCNATDPNNQIIYICAHGEIEDTTNCYYEKFDSDKYDKLMSVKELSAWLLSVLNESNYININIPVNIVLAMCFAARSFDSKINHIDNKDSIDFSKTFAGYLACELANIKPNLIVSISAFIGEVSFNDLNGDIQVSIEERFLEYPIIHGNQIRLHELGKQIEKLDQEQFCEIAEDKERLASLENEYNVLNSIIFQQSIRLNYATNYGMVTYEKSGGNSPLIINHDGLMPHAMLEKESEEQSEQGCQVACTVLSPKIGRR